MELISSRSNPAIVAAAKLKNKKYRDETGTFMFDGIKLLSEALNSGVCLQYIFINEDNQDKIFSVLRDCGDKVKNVLKNTRVIVVSDSVFEKLSEEKSPEGVICVAKYIDKINYLDKIDSETNTEVGFGRIFLACSLRDPGNLGTVIRSAAVFGIDSLFISGDCADIYNSKTVRASMGALFRQKLYVCGNLTDTVKALCSERFGYRIYAAALISDSVKLDEMKVMTDGKTGFLIGNEGHGLSPHLISECTGTVFIPMEPGNESLNASAAAAVLMWEGYKVQRNK